MDRNLDGTEVHGSSFGLSSDERSGSLRIVYDSCYRVSPVEKD